ncbi:hypothetical protein SLL00_10930, partial [Metabacillus indicus]|uniref:hypothetical protein n=1 Tax=Metabacillus indicus TaxID=246786 RepID=UPI002A05F04C
MVVLITLLSAIKHKIISVGGSYHAVECHQAQDFSCWWFLSSLLVPSSTRFLLLMVLITQLSAIKHEIFSVGGSYHAVKCHQAQNHLCWWFLSR